MATTPMDFFAIKSGLSRCGLIGRGSGALAGALGLLVLIGYSCRVAIFFRPVSGYPATQPAAAMCLVLISFAALARPRWPVVALSASGAAACLLLLRLDDIWAHTALLPMIVPFASNLGQTAAGPGPAALAWNTDAGLLTICSSQILAWRRAWTASQVVACLAVVPFAIALIGYIYRVNAFYGGLGPGTAFASLLAVAATLLAEPEHGIMRAILSDGAPGRFGRRLLIGSAMTTFLIGWALSAESDATNRALLATEVVLVTAFLSAVVMAGTVQFDRSDRRRLQQEADLRRALETLGVSERNLGQRTHLLETTLEHIEQGIIMTDAHRHVVICNRHAAEMMDLPSDLIGSRLTFEEVLAHPERTGDDLDAEIQNMLRDVGPSGRPRTYERQRPDGRTIEVRSVPLNKGGVVCTLSDITARRVSEERLRQAQRLETVGRLAAGVAHDFNNILQSIVGGLELVLDEVDKASHAHEVATIAMHSAMRGSSLTHHLLSYARKQMLQPQAIEMAPLLTAVQTLLARTLDPQIAIRVRADQIPPVLADPGQLQTALLNLAINASYAMPQGGVLSVDTRVATEKGRVWVVLTVADTGVGMDAATLAQAVEPFFTTKGLDGSGLGLSMVQGFAEQSGGRFSITSMLGQGTTVELRLPAAAPDSDAERLELAKAPPASGRVLLVDDSTDMLETTGASLEKAGFTVVRVESGERALALLAQGERFDALVTDYAMPGLSGAVLIAEAQSVQPGLQGVLITGYADIGHAYTLPEGTPVLHKPFQRTELLEALQHIMERDRDKVRETAPSLTGHGA